eukprot:76042-Amphidinium_carterae.2
MGQGCLENIEIPQMDTTMNKDYTGGRHWQVWTSTLDQQQRETIQPPPCLEQPAYTCIHPTPKALARQDHYKPPHRLTGKQPYPIVAQLHDISVKKETTWENEDKEEKTEWRQT